MAELYFEDFAPGAVRTFGDHPVERDAMVAFAEAYDAQPFHVDEAAAAASPVGRLIASGWYTACLQMRMVCDGTLLRAAGLGAPGIDELKWLRPVAAGDRLSVRETIVETRASASRPDRGLVRFRYETLNQSGEPVLQQTNWGFFLRRGAEREGGAAPAPAAASGYTPPPPARAEDEPTDFDSVAIGRVAGLGSFTFTRESVIAFARDFDPQPFHLDDAAAAAGPFGALAASGWHTASAWMSRLVAHRAAVREAAECSGRPAPRWGVSPGFRDLQWRRPVFVGDTIHYATEPVEKRVSASRPGWGLVFSRNTGHNQHGELVFAFRGGGFMARRSE